MAHQQKSAGDGIASASALHTGISANPSAEGMPREARPDGLPALPMRAGEIKLAALINLYMAHYDGRDSTRLQRLTWWTNRIGDVALQDVTDDHIHEAIESLSHQSSRYFAGNDVDGKPIFKAKPKKQLSPATLNRYSASIASVFSWAIKKRVAPKGFIHPCRAVERRPENNEKTRFLSDGERDRLLEACKQSTWKLLYLLVLIALTTGARKSEITGLKWAAIDLKRGTASVDLTKNGEPKVLPLVPRVVALLTELPQSPTALVFASRRRPDKPYAFEAPWKLALQEAKIKNFRFHDCRHSCASMLAQNGATLLEIADLLGHKQLQMTKRYSHLGTSHKAALVNRVLGSIGG